MKRHRTILCLIVPALAIPATPASALTPRDGSFLGRTSARAPVKFTVLPGGRAVRGFVVRVRYRCATNSPVVSARFAPARSLRVRRGAFSGRDGFVVVRGRFVSRTRARGTVRVARRLSSRTVCRGRATWTARRH